MRLCGVTWLLLTALCCSTPGWSQSTQAACVASNESEKALLGLLDAHRRVSFRGALLYEREGSRQFIDVDWSADSGEARLRRLNRIEDPSTETWAPPVFTAGRFCDLLEFYIPRVEQGRVIAGRTTQRLALQPKDTLRLGYIVEVDSEIALPLAMVTVDPDGKVLERYEFASIIFSNAAAGTKAAPEDATGIVRGKSVLPGFYVMDGHATPAAFVVSDGLATASIFLEPLPSGVAPGEAGVTKGATLTYTRGVPVTGQNGMLISVLGEVPLVTARLLADAIRPGIEAP